MLKLIKRMLPVLVCAVIFVMSGALDAECSAEEDYGYFGALEDHQDALSGEQAQELLDILDSTAREIHANVGVILGNASLDGLSERSYAKEFHNRSFGEESNSIVLMLVKTGSHKQDQIYSSEHAYDMYNPRLDDIFDAVYDGLDSSGGDNYYAAVTNYCAYLRSHDSVPPKVDINIGHVGGVIVALIIAVCVANSQAAKYKKRAPVSARRYMDGSLTRFTQRGDVFVREYTTSHRISSSSSGGSRHSGAPGSTADDLCFQMIDCHSSSPSFRFCFCCFLEKANGAWQQCPSLQQSCRWQVFADSWWNTVG